MGWTDKKVAELRKLWLKGLTTSEIGKKLEVSKNAVVGKAHRLGLDPRESPIGNPPVSAKRKAAAAPSKPAAPAKAPAAPPKKTGKQPAPPVKEPPKAAQKQKPAPAPAPAKAKTPAPAPVQKPASKPEPVQAPPAKKNGKPAGKAAAPEKHKGISAAELTSRTCCWPENDPKDPNFYFCGREVFMNKPYCLDHCARAYVGISKK